METAQDLTRRKQLIDLIASAETLDELLAAGPTQRIAEFFGAERATIYAVDAKNNHLYSLAKTGNEVPEIRVERKPTSVAGFVGTTRKAVVITNCYDPAELLRVDPALKFDDRWDQATGFRTNTMMAVPIVYQKFLIGVVQVVNRADGRAFTLAELDACEQICRQLGDTFAGFNRVKPAKRATTMPTESPVAAAAGNGAAAALSADGGAPGGLPAAAAVPAQRTKSKWAWLLDNGKITKEALTKALNDSTSAGIEPARWLFERANVKRDDVETSLAAFYRVPAYRFKGHETIPEDIKPYIQKHEFLKDRSAVPIAREGAKIAIIIDDPFDLTRTDAVRRIFSDLHVEWRIGLKDEITACISRSFVNSGNLDDILKDFDKEWQAQAGQSSEETEEQLSHQETQDSALIELANKIIADAFMRNASDIHIEPYGKEMKTRIRFRVDGECLEYRQVDAKVRMPLVARIKIMAGLDIAERRKPQDGKIKFTLPDKRPIELRVATIPTVNGNEDVVMRILAASKPLPLDQIGLSQRNLDELRVAMDKPYGLVLCVGPTGSGKTTTLHSALGFINKADIKIWTAEDPVEITQYGLRQVQVQPKIGFTFAAAMRAFLRADPDVIMVGEMRDKETAETGVEASLTGHLVVSTLHTNSAPETITRLLDMELDPFSFADSLLCVLAQRLARSLCKECKEQYAPSDDEWEVIASSFGEEGIAARGWKRGEIMLWRGRGCGACGDTGYRGRLGLHELLVNNDEIKHHIGKKAPVEQIRDLAVKGGMTTLLQDGIEKCFSGKTDLKQVLAVCSK